jgi:hypothetical protein
VSSLASILRRDPREFVERVAAIAEGRIEPYRVPRPDYETTPWEDLVGRATAVLGPAFATALDEPALREIEDEIRGSAARLSASAPYTLAHNADARLARCCYAVCRAVRPRVVVETGVGYGVTTSYVLAALEQNRAGELHSVDLPPLDRGAEDYAGALVPERLRSRWTFRRGMSRRVLPGVLQRVRPVDVFLHDSMHTYDNMRFELREALTAMRGGGVLLADDVEGNAAFAELRGHAHTLWAVSGQAEKDGLLGIFTTPDSVARTSGEDSP